MKASPLLLDRLEFKHIHVVANDNYSDGLANEFPQLNFDFKGVLFNRKSSIDYPDEETADPRHLIFNLGIKLDAANQKEGTLLPYDIEVEASAFFRYIGEEMHGADRFRAVRASGYQILYGAIREMVANLSARGTFGLLQLPSANFSRAAELESEEDELNRQELLMEISDKAQEKKTAIEKKRKSKKSTNPTTEKSGEK